MIFNTWVIDFSVSGRLLVYISCSQLVGNIFNLLIKMYLSLILIKYLINESRVKISHWDKNALQRKL
jgi:hypothetical protein